MTVPVSRFLVATCCLLAAVQQVPAAAAADGATGKLTVGGKSVDLTHAYAYMDKTGNDARDAVVVLLTDSVVPPDAIQNEYARKKLVAAGTLHYVELLLVGGKQIHYDVQHHGFGLMMEPGGDDADHALEMKAGDGKIVAGHARTTGAQKSMDDVPYSYDVTFTAAVAPHKES